ncbi:Protein LTV1-like [Hondaea fermentalgiana]|uniref:Protein LTV1-like n=1 Tax=Hondaea fermentalgiana TaxID=2315210 RepID=A0A2R5GLZ9_9STRA|nr:Protein LTV1-like [Hondaea fermentalgiana]|eukprot:GBG31916.1 Protein LTV1-like [Hondaea fermentalgiana]
MGRKRQFINKRDAHKFVLMHRSQQDPEYYREGGSKFVLHPADRATAKALHKLGLGSQVFGGDEFEDPDAAAAARGASSVASRSGELREVDELGLPIDGYDYHKHLAAIDGSGTFVDSTGRVKEKGTFASAKAADENANLEKEKKTVRFQDEVDENDEGEGEGRATGAAKASGAKGLSLPGEMFASEREYDRMLEAITLRPDSLDPEMKALLEEGMDHDDEGEDMDEYVGTLDDDFMHQLLQAEAEAPDEDVFDFDAHMARLMAQAEAEEGGAGDDEYDDEDDEYDEEGLAEIIARASGSRKLRDIDLHFETVLARDYDDDEIGELEHRTYDDRVAGTIELTSEHVQKLVDAFLREQAEDKNRTHEIGATRANLELKETSKQLVDEGATGLVAEEEVGRDKFGNDIVPDAADGDAQTKNSVEADADADADGPSKDEILRHFGYEDRPVAQWDCETIVSTYSVLDNHPTVIPVERRRRRKPAATKPIAEDSGDEENNHDQDEADALDHEAPAPLEGDVDLSAFVGLSAGLDVPFDALTERTKDETPEEKRARKKLVKMQQRMRRQEKKTTRAMFKQEKKRQQNAEQKLKQAAAPPQGATVLHF